MGDLRQLDNNPHYSSAPTSTLAPTHTTSTPSPLCLFHPHKHKSTLAPLTPQAHPPHVLEVDSAEGSRLNVCDSQRSLSDSTRDSYPQETCFRDSLVAKSTAQVDEHEGVAVQPDHQSEACEELRVWPGQEDGDEADQRTLPCPSKDHGGMTGLYHLAGEFREQFLCRFLHLQLKILTLNA